MIVELQDFAHGHVTMDAFTMDAAASLAYSLNVKLLRRFFSLGWHSVNHIPAC